MKLLPLVAALLLLPGCGILLPKQVELFQRKVKAVPELSEDAKETQRQAAERIAKEAQKALEGALRDHAGTNVLLPLKGTYSIADALSASLGPPDSHYSGSVGNLVDNLQFDLADYNKDLRDYADDVEKDVGKKIEGTGLVRIGYFTMIGGLFLIGFILWTATKVYGVFNPVVGGVTSVIGRVSSSLVNKGFTQVVHGGEMFKDALDKANLSEETANYIKLLFVNAHKQAQDADVKKVVAGITRYEDSAPLPPS